MLIPQQFAVAAGSTDRPSEHNGQQCYRLTGFQGARASVQAGFLPT